MIICWRVVKGKVEELGHRWAALNGSTADQWNRGISDVFIPTVELEDFLLVNKPHRATPMHQTVPMFPASWMIGLLKSYSAFDCR